jgi:integrase
MSVRKIKGSSRWHYDFAINGVRFRGSTKAKTKREAEIIEAREYKRVLLGDAGARELTFNEAAERYYQEHAQHQPSAGDVDRQLERLNRAFGLKLLSRITDADVAEFVARRRSEPKRYGGLPAPATVNREVELLRRVMNKADRAWKINVARINWQEHLLPEPQERIRELTTEEERRLFAALRPDFHSLVRFCLLTGVRLGAATRLTWSQVDDVAGVITLKTKGNARTEGDRTQVIPITAAVLTLLAGERGKHPIFPFVYQCARSRGKRRKGEYYPFRRDTVRKPWDKARTAAGIEDFRFHDTRHTAATRVLRASRNLKVVQKMLGHASIETTARYAHVQLDDVREAMEAASPRQSFVEVQDAAEQKSKA